MRSHLPHRRLHRLGIALTLILLALAPLPAGAAPATTGAWTQTGSLATAREGATATLLADGTVLIVGGRADGQSVASVERYDPANGAWRAAASLTTARSEHTATLLA
ncbi:MAG: kelch repeat-containing protein, partial [Thermomicrobiales bacterium]